MNDQARITNYGRAKANRGARATGPYCPVTRRTERVWFSSGFPLFPDGPARLCRAGSPAGRASGPCHPGRRGTATPVTGSGIRARVFIRHSEFVISHFPKGR